MPRLVTNLILATVALFVLAVVPRHWFKGAGREVGLLSERVCPEGSDTCQVHSLAEGVEGWWPQAGTIAFGAGLVAAASLVVGRLAKQRRFGHLALLASALAFTAGVAFVLGKPTAAYTLNMGPVLMLLAALFGMLTGRVMARGPAAIPGQASRDE